MNEHLLKYRISPRVVHSNKKQKIQVEGLDESCKFFDDIEYTVKITAKEIWDFKENSQYMWRTDRKCNAEIICKPIGGIIEFEYFFAGEQEWKITVSRTKSDKHIPEHYKKYWPWLAEGLNSGFSFSVYSLEEDLYGKKPYKGDLHIHTYGSDGHESSAMVAAQYRKFGYDFISITDHYRFEPSLEAIETFKNIDTGMKLFTGEEVHPIVGGAFHIVNFNADLSVNEIIRNNPERTEQEVEKIALENGIDKEIAWFKWIYAAIRKAGGISIYPHPYWVIEGAYNIHSAASEEVLKRGLCDVFEIIGGTDKIHNRMQVQLYYEMRDRGHKLPIVASSDSHSSLVRGQSRFDQAWTVVFSENRDKIPENILNGMSVAVDNFDVNDKNVYGTLRLVKYTWFLIENYYELHDSYCNAAGQAILRYVLGDKTQDALISMLENELKKFDEGFFSNKEK